MKTIAWFLLCVMILTGCHEEIAEPPKADFSGVPNMGTVQFRNSSAGATSFTWDFGDGSALSKEMEPQHIYTKSDTYKVKLLASGAGGTSARTISIIININSAAQKPVAIFESENNGCLAPCDVSFVNNTTNADQYSWDFGNGQKSTTRTPGAIRYTEAGTYTVRLDVSGPGGTSNTSRSVTIRSQASTTLAKEWDHSFGGTEDDVLNSVISLSDGGFVLVGSTESQPTNGRQDFLIIRLNSSRQVVWKKNYGGAQNEGARAVIEFDGGFLVGGYSDSSPGGSKEAQNRGTTDMWVMKLNQNGDKLWDKSFGGNSYDEINTILPVSGGALLGGFSRSNQNNGTRTSPLYGDNDMWLVKIDNSGTEQWQQTYGGAGDDRIQCAVAADDGGFFVAGYSGSDAWTNKSSAYYGWYDFWVVKIDARGTRQWDRSFGGKAMDMVNAIAKAPDGGVLLGGNSESVNDGNKTLPKQSASTDSWIVKIKSNGDKEWEKNFASSKNNYLSGIAATADGGYLLIGLTDSDRLTGDVDGWVAKINGTGDKVWDARYGGNQIDYLRCITKTPDGGFVIGATSFSETSGTKTAPLIGKDDFWLLKLK